MDKKQLAIAFVIVIIAVVAVFSITMFYVPSTQDSEALAGMAYQIYREGGFIPVEQDVYFWGADGRQYQLMLVAEDVPDCVDTDGSVDSTYAGYTSGTVPGMGHYRANDSCASQSILLEVACGDDVLADDSRNAGIASAAGLDISDTAMILGITNGPTIFNRRAKWQGRCYDLVVPPETADASYMGQILWNKDSQCTVLGRYQCFGNVSYVCDVQGSRNVLVLNEDCAAQNSECDVDPDSSTYGQCVGGQIPEGDPCEYEYEIWSGTVPHGGYQCPYDQDNLYICNNGVWEFVTDCQEWCDQNLGTFCICYQGDEDWPDWPNNQGSCFEPECSPNPLDCAKFPQLS